MKHDFLHIKLGMFSRVGWNKILERLVSLPKEYTRPHKDLVISDVKNPHADTSCLPRKGWSWSRSVLFAISATSSVGIQGVAWERSFGRTIFSGEPPVEVNDRPLTVDEFAWND